jgi:hypothetical protein
MPTHRLEDRWTTRTCPSCGEAFECYTNSPRTYCGMACYKQAQERTRVTTTCPGCNTTFTFVKSWPRIYCSNQCAGRANVGNITRWKPSSYQAVCEQCRERFTTTVARTRGRFCSRSCYGQWLRIHAPPGAEAPNWRGGYEPYYGPNWRKVRRQVREERGACEDCGITAEEFGRALDVHHIRAFREFGRARYLEANDQSNLAVLCNACHTAREWKTPGRVA